MGGSSSSRRDSSNGVKTQALSPSTRTSFPVCTGDVASDLQKAVDRIFSNGGESLQRFEFSFSIADPLVDGCPLIGCSTGFTELCGYQLNEIVGRNCRFLVDGVPAQEIDKRMRGQTRAFCEAVAARQDYWRPPSEREAWMPQGRPADEFLAMQRNARKDGTLFNNMFYMKVFNVSADLGDEQPYIIGLQTELEEGTEDLKKLAKNIEQLDANMAQVKKVLASSFFVQTCIDRQSHITQAAANLEREGAGRDMPSNIEAPSELHSAFPSSEVRPWKESEYKKVEKLADATRNGGVVLLMKKGDQLVAVKQMPNKWMRDSHEEFLRTHPSECELPWQDIGAMRFLNSVNFKYACKLWGVYRSDLHTYVVSTFASEGDLFSAAEGGADPGPKREEELKPIVFELFTALQQLHDLGIVHRDISLENVLRTRGEDGKSKIKIIDFGMAATGRYFQSCARGKASYEAPEMQGSDEYDAFLSDMFATGVVVYGMLVKDYPWQSTKPGRCKCYDYVKQAGFRAYTAKRCLRGSKKRISEALSEPLMCLFEGMLSLDPAKRLTLGEKAFTERRSVWDEKWMQSGFQI